MMVITLRSIMVNSLGDTYHSDIQLHQFEHMYQKVPNVTQPYH